MRVLVTFAVDAEFAPWRKLRKLQTVNVSGFALFRAPIGRAQVDFVLTGMGFGNAFRTASAAMQEPYQFCITAGFAGSLKEAHSVGTILVAEGVQQLGKSKTLECGRRLVRAAQMDGANQVKLFLTADHVVRTAEEKAQLAPFADAVEMESFAILSAAACHKLSTVAIRVVSDSLRQDMPAIVETAVDEHGRIRIGNVVRHVARHPLQLPALIRLGRDSRTAAEALAHFLEAYIKRISFLTHGWFPEGENLEELAAR
jgi:nucleoside phosphorylase